MTSRKVPPQPVATQDAALLIVEPEMMHDPVSLDFDDDTGTRFSVDVQTMHTLSYGDAQGATAFLRKSCLAPGLCHTYT